MPTSRARKYRRGRDKHISPRESQPSIALLHERRQPVRRLLSKSASEPSDPPVLQTALAPSGCMPSTWNAYIRLAPALAHTNEGACMPVALSPSNQPLSPKPVRCFLLAVQSSCCAKASAASRRRMQPCIACASPRSAGHYPWGAEPSRRAIGEHRQTWTCVLLHHVCVRVHGQPSYHANRNIDMHMSFAWQQD